MCGRTACTLNRVGLRKALCYKPSESNQYVQPEWKNDSVRGRYKPSCNISPGGEIPVLLSGKHLGLQSERVLQPMLWGLIPHWVKDINFLKKYHLFNCRIDSLSKSHVFRNQFLKGQRCVVACDGFYKWKSTHENTLKQPYFLYMPQPEGIKIEDETTWNIRFDMKKGWSGPNLVKMAAIFDKWISETGKEIYSCSIITVESSKKLSSIHYSMPAILETEELVANWLDFESFSVTSALSILKQTKQLMWHPVSTDVNNGRNQFDYLKQPISKKLCAKQSPTEKKKKLGTKKKKKKKTATKKKEKKIRIGPNRATGLKTKRKIKQIQMECMRKTKAGV